MHSNSFHFSPSKFSSLRINFIPEDDGVHENSRTTVELYCRNRKDVNLVNWRDRLKKHNEDYDEFIEPSIKDGDINVVVSKVNQYDHPTISELRYRYNNKIITKKLRDYNIHTEELSGNQELLFNTSNLISFISKYSKNVDLLSELKNEIDEFVKGNKSNKKEIVSKTN